VHAAPIPVGAVTAWRALFDAAGLKEGQKVLIHGAAGGVGSFAVQLAKWQGAYVIGTASTGNQSFLRQLGVDEPIDYEKTRFEDVVHDVDVVFDPIEGFSFRLSPHPRQKKPKSMMCARPSYCSGRFIAAG
jgi:NADPH:quinone reductase-like Zn-dependent oxidoreductase